MIKKAFRPDIRGRYIKYKINIRERNTLDFLIFYKKNLLYCIK